MRPLSSANSALESEMRGQGATLEQRAEPGREAARRAAAILERADVRYLVVAARGSSDNAGRYAQYLLGAEARLNVALAAPSLFASGEAAPDLDGAAVLGISQSGQSPDVVGVLGAARAQGRPTIAITNDEQSPMAREADVTLALGAVEHSVAATKTYLASLHAVVQMLEELRPDPVRRRWLSEMPGLVSAMVEQQLSSRERFDELDAARRLTVLGRGLSYATAHETALKIRELAGLATETFSPSDLLHGPIAGLHRDGWLWLADGGGVDYAELRAKLGERAGPTVAVSQSAALVAVADVGVQLPPDVPAWLASLLAVIPGQVAGLRLAEMRGVDLDEPHGLSKVTLTR